MAESNKAHACNECRRRKARCSRELPVCAQCLQWRRHCLYEKPKRSPLTRKYLTEVEESLRITTQIIRDHGLNVDLDAELARARNGTSQTYRPSPPKSEVTTPPGGLKRSRMATDEPVEDRDKSPEYTQIESGIFEPCLEMLISDGSIEEPVPTDFLPTATTDNPVANGADYDWDERNTEAQSCIDGMAALSIQGVRPGYLGLASGAVLLHLIKSHFTDPFSAALPNTSQSNPETEPSQKVQVNLQREIPPHKIEAYVASYFNEYHTNYPLVHQGLFMAHFHEIVPRPKYGWTVLMYIVAALGAFMSATSPNDDDLVLYQCARSHLSVEILEVGSLTLVQSLSLISNYLQKRDRPNSSHNYLGLAVRMAYGLGLHKDHPSVEGNLLYREIRRRTWWCLYIFDAGSTITFSRPLAIPSAGIDSKLPLNISESDLTVSATVAPESINAPTIYTNVRVQSQFHLLTNHIYNRIISKPSPSAKQVLEWDDFYMTKWLNLVPEYYKETATVPVRHQFAHAIMTWRYKHFRLIIYRPFLIQKTLQIARPQTAYFNAFPIPPSNIETSPASQPYIDLACERCQKESHETITCIDKFWNSTAHTRMACWYALYFLFSATLVPVILLHSEPQSPLVEAWQEDIDKAIAIIKSMVGLSPFAGRCFETLERLRNGVASPGPEMGETVQEMPTLSDPLNQIPLAQLFSSSTGWFEVPEVYFEEQMW
ncbi:Lactose regulatory protein LAC9 [Penicillium argentinense]|uniref:Lactose regulatory protein LAC9 n=1 Tax=Penicillium argentinense TaxID=1131581 RepID=A0A9W9EPY7_9EURO|nr:Lactose regulatory protein LAC9 [Penicillium argentinense]KAJ5085857.1 Lactose regulatory protein LAC9 [Penicillium argentinense]